MVAEYFKVSLCNEKNNYLIQPIGLLNTELTEKNGGCKTASLFMRTVDGYLISSKNVYVWERGIGKRPQTTQIY